MSRLLTPAELEALRAHEPFVPAPTETYRVSVEAGHADVAPETIEALQPGTVIPLTAAKPGLVEVVANAVVVAYGRLEDRDGAPAVRVTHLAPGRPGRASHVRGRGAGERP